MIVVDLSDDEKEDYDEWVLPGDEEDVGDNGRPGDEEENERTVAAYPSLHAPRMREGDRRCELGCCGREKDERREETKEHAKQKS